MGMLWHSAGPEASARDLLCCCTCWVGRVRSVAQLMTSYVMSQVKRRNLDNSSYSSSQATIHLSGNLTTAQSSRLAWTRHAAKATCVGGGSRRAAG